MGRDAPLPAKPAPTKGADAEAFKRGPRARLRARTMTCERCQESRLLLAFPGRGWERQQPCRVCVPGGTRLLTCEEDE